MEELRHLVVDTTNKFLLDNMPDDDDDLAPDPALQGHALQHLLSKARCFDSEFREHRSPTAPGGSNLPNNTEDASENVWKKIRTPSYPSHGTPESTGKGQVA